MCPPPPVGGHLEVKPGWSEWVDKGLMRSVMSPRLPTLMAYRATHTTHDRSVKSNVIMTA